MPIIKMLEINFIRLGKTQKQMILGNQQQTFKLGHCELGLI